MAARYHFSWKNIQEIKHFTRVISLSGCSPEPNHVSLTLCLLPLGEAASLFKTPGSGTASAYEDWSVTGESPTPHPTPQTFIESSLNYFIQNVSANGSRWTWVLQVCQSQISCEGCGDPRFWPLYFSKYPWTKSWYMHTHASQWQTLIPRDSID